MPFIWISMGIVICCSTSSASRPGHCVITCTQVLAMSGYASTGSVLNAITPQRKSSTAMLRTMKRLSRAFSMAVESLLLDRVLEFQRVPNYFLPGAHAAKDFLHAAGQHLAAGYFHAPKLFSRQREVHPILVVQMQNRGRWHRCVGLLRFAMECRRNEHPGPHHSRVAHLNPHFRCALAWIQHRANVADHSGEKFVGIRVQPDIHFFSQMHVAQVVFE